MTTSTGLLSGGVPYLAAGVGPPLVRAMGLSPTCEAPTGMDRRMEMSAIKPLLRDFRVWTVNRKPGLQPGSSMSDIAGHLASAIEADFGEPVFLTGTSTGGSIALQLAADRPDLVRALVIVASAYRLGPNGRELQRILADRTRAGDGASGWAHLMTGMMPAPLRRPAFPLARLAMRSMTPADPSDLLVTLDAEDAFDVGDQLERITAPTLVIGGAKDVFYTRDLFEETAARVADGRAYVYPKRGHGRVSTSSETSVLSLGFLLAARRP